MLNNLKIYMICIAIYYSYQNECKLKNAISLYAICMIKQVLDLEQEMHY